MKKFDKKAAFYFGAVMAVFFIILNLWTADDLDSSIWKSIIGGLIAGIVSGLVFGLLIGLFKSSKFVEKTTQIETQPDENIFFQTPANHFKGMEGVGGKLYLTNKRLVFKSHKGNFQNHELSIPLADIQSADRYKNLGLINNGLKITSNGNQVDKFVVEKAGEWVEKLRQTVLSD